MKLDKKNVRHILITAIIALLFCVLAYATYTTYDAYTQLVIEQQQQHLLIISRAVSQNINLFLSEQIRDMEILIRTPGFIGEFNKYYEYGNIRGVKEYILSYMISNHEGLSRAYLLDRDGNLVYRYNQYPFLKEFDEDIIDLKGLMDRGQTGIGSAFPIGDGNYAMTVINIIYDGNDYLGAVVGIIDLQSLYQRLVLPLDFRDSDYIMVKDSTGTIIMHPVSEMMGFNYREDIKELYTDDKYHSMLQVLTRQYEYEEGTAMCRSYINADMSAVDEIMAYTRMNLGGTSWFISAVMPTNEALKPVNDNLSQLALSTAIMMMILIAAFTTIFNLQRNRQRLEMQTRYLKEINHTLEELHQSREQIRHYQKLQTIGALAGGIAHEFNNLLTPILGYCEFIKEQMVETNPYYEDVDEIYKAGARAKEIVEQILPFSRRETEETPFSSVSVDAVIRDSLKMVRMILPSSIKLDEKLTKTGVNVYGSATQLNQVMLNLCTNAYQSMESMESGTLTVEVAVVGYDRLPEGFHMADVQSVYVSITVADTGCGMDDQVLKRIFDPFFTTKEAGEGTGLGLSVAQSILMNHGGYIDAESHTGKGSMFTMYLPVTDIPVVQGQPKPSPAYVEKRPVRLLLVDDENRIVQYLKKRLVKKGFEVDAFTDAERALEAFSLEPDNWNLLIVDYTMPKYKGTHLARMIKKLRPDFPVLLITGLVEKDALQMKQAGVLDGILIKPLDFDELLQSISDML